MVKSKNEIKYRFRGKIATAEYETKNDGRTCMKESMCEWTKRIGKELNINTQKEWMELEWNNPKKGWEKFYTKIDTSKMGMMGWFLEEASKRLKENYGK